MCISNLLRSLCQAIMWRSLDIKVLGEVRRSFWPEVGAWWQVGVRFWWIWYQFLPANHNKLSY